MNTTIIIPTLYKRPDTLELTINNFSNKYRIHIIDNTKESLCKKYENSCKVSYFPVNIGVNPAWNFGIQNCNTKYYLLLNDDVILPYNIINISENILDSNPFIGLLTFKTIENLPITVFKSMFINRIKEPKIELITPSSLFKRQGWFMFGRTDEYIFIPDELKIFFGDDFIYMYTQKNGLKTVIDINNCIGHFTSSTVKQNPDHNLIFHREAKIYTEIYNYYLNKEKIEKI